MISPDPCWQGLTIEEQSIIQYRLPGKLNDRMSVTLFLKGRVMREADGCPEKASRILFGEEHGEHLIAPIQKHKTACVDAKPLWALPSRPEADAVFIRRSGIFGSLRFADCLPVVIVSENPFDWCLLIHSGFIGTLSGITPRVLNRIRKITGQEGLESSHAWIGPGIGFCCYFRKANDPLTLSGIRSLPSDCVKRDGNRVYFDLSKATVTFLYDIGIPSTCIHDSGICTSCFPDLCHSYRKGDRDERSLLLARIYPECHNNLHWWENMRDGVCK